jgi:ribosomal protein L7Ae-like RNA K-turn-binding protein
MDQKHKLACSLTGNIFYLKQMLLFKEMNDFLICDVNAKLNEKGIWCNPSRYDIEKAIESQVFDKILNTKLKIQSSFTKNIENSLKLKVLNLVGLSKKAGLLEIGYDKVVKSLKNNSIDVVLIAKEDSKLEGVFLKKIDGRKILLNKTFSRSEISKAVGYKNVLCVAIMISNLSATLNSDFYKLMKFKLIIKG